MIRALLDGQLNWHLPLLFIVVCIGIAYFVFMIRNRLLMQDIKPLLFSLGLLLLYLAIGSPLLSISYLSFSFHMIQMSFLYFIIPPLLLLGIPQQLYKTIVNKTVIKKYDLSYLSPHASLILFSALFLLYHLPVFLSVISQHTFFQTGYIAVLFIVSFRMWWPLTSPDVKQRFTASKKKKYLMQSSMYLMPACLLFIISALLADMGNPFLGQMAAHLCLPADSSIQILPPPFNTKYDQMFAGIVMMALHKSSLMVTSSSKSNHS